MNETDEIVYASEPPPKIAHVEKANGPFSLLVTWASGRREGREVIDAAPQISTFKIYKPLRDDADLFAKVSVSEDGTAVVWPGNADLEVSADVLEELAQTTMSCEGFSQFLREMGWTLDAAAAQLGISRRLVAYYSKEREIPRYIGLACEALRHRCAHEASRKGDTLIVASLTSGGFLRDPRRGIQ